MPFQDFFRKPSAAVSHDTNSYDGSEDHKDPIVASDTVLNAPVRTDGKEEVVSDDALDGVKKARATTIVWTRKALIISYALIFLIFFVNSLQQQMAYNLTAYVTSSFYEMPLVATTSIVSQLTAGLIKLPVAKIMDIWGRPQGFVFMLACATLGLILTAACTSVTMYAAAQVFWWVGFDGIAYVLDVFIADTSSLEWRALMFAFSTSPYIATTFAGPALAEAFYKTSGWRWPFGAFAIITPCMCLPFLWNFWYHQRLARKQGVILPRREASGRSWYQSVQHYFLEFDVVGIIFIVAGFALFLLPFNLASSAASSWKTGHIIAMLVIGFCLLIAFPLWERFGARKPFLPFHFLADRTILGSCLLAGTLYVSFYCWDAYFSSLLQVVWGLSIKDAGYVANIYSIGSCFWGIVIGFAIRASGRFKWTALVAVPVMILGSGLMIYFRQPGQHIGYVIMCQIFIAFSGGTLVIAEQLAIMAAAGPENVAVVLALQAAFTSVGGAIGNSISGAIWTNTMPGALERYLPADVTSNATAVAEIYASLTVQLSYPMGSPTRDGIIQAYGYSQRLMCIASTAVLVLAFFWVLMWKDIRVKDFKKPVGSTVV